jgi:hypothetical protein
MRLKPKLNLHPHLQVACSLVPFSLSRGYAAGAPGVISQGSALFHQAFNLPILCSLFDTTARAGYHALSLFFMR